MTGLRTLMEREQSLSMRADAARSDLSLCIMELASCLQSLTVT
jgi:hypothetical protein